ncbi:MAG: flagellar motor protein MotB [Candidatus Marinimicrobia bacterium]|nr:flagellar motor protein MotB [Candidatus Neomarinimicrobiota bacterium]
MARNNKNNDDLDQPSSPAWMTTYGDMMTLLLCFFVLLLSFSTIDKIKFSKSMRALQGALGIMPRMQRVSSSKQSSLDSEKIINKMNLEEKVKQLKELSKSLGYEEEVEVLFNEGGLLIRLGNKVLFDLGEAELRKSAYPILTFVGNTIKEHNADDVIVGGHTDNLPISSSIYPSNWELSIARSLSVVKFMIDSVNVPPKKLIAAGFSQYHPLKPNDTPENRQKNRRVEFMFNW